jgi:uncharacterized protein YndB with AHSA1/START domain
MDTQITTKLKILKPANEVFEAIVGPDKMSNYWFSSGTGRVERLIANYLLLYICYVIFCHQK